MTERERWKARRDKAQRAACASIMKRTHSEICQEHFPHWPEDKIALAWSIMSAEGLIDEMIDLSKGMSDEQWAAVRHIAERAGGES